MIVLDASAAVSALLSEGPVRERLAQEAAHAPHLIDTEIVDALRKLVIRQVIGLTDATRALTVWRRLGVTRYAATGLADRVWQLRDDLSAYDATYVALAEALGCTLVTADRRIAAAPGRGCPVEVAPR